MANDLDDECSRLQQTAVTRLDHRGSRQGPTISVRFTFRALRVSANPVFLKLWTAETRAIQIKAAVMQCFSWTKPKTARNSSLTGNAINCDARTNSSFASEK